MHLACALGATAAFWVAGFSFKGGPRHRSAGEWFRRLIYAAAFTGGVLALAGIAVPAWGHPMQPGQTADAWADALQAHRQTMWVVLYVLLIIVAPAQHGIAVVAAGPSPARVRSRLHATLNLSCLAGTVLLLAASVTWQRWIFLTLAPIGFTIGLRNLSYASRRVSHVERLGAGAPDQPRDRRRHDAHGVARLRRLAHARSCALGAGRSVAVGASGGDRMP